ARLRENPAYVTAFQALFGAGIFDQPEAAYRAMTESIAAFEQTDYFAPFDSKYDRYLRGEYEMTTLEELGMTLFFSQQFTNCNLCHQLKPAPHRAGETFSSYQYHNIGVPVNKAARAVNGAASDHIDRGLLDNPNIDDPVQAGKFKTPTLRNVAVTAPYMHNGVFRDLRTVVLFYNKYNSKSVKRQFNPETGERWRAPEVPENISLQELETGPALQERRIDALVAFLRTLTDRRYEHLLDQQP
ncbi:MAG: methylamine utilization protein MauG, partial [Gammaproteobacteria bacterium]|nr:methylamine utilization protein MauG [Gammaproteobacteria bacterium]